MKQLIGIALGTLLSLGTVTAAFASGTNVAAPVSFPDDGVETIVVTAKRPAAQPVADDAGRDARGRATQGAVAEPVEVIVVTAKRPTRSNAERTPPAMPIVLPKLELAAEPLVIRL